MDLDLVHNKGCDKKWRTANGARSAERQAYCGIKLWTGRQDQDRKTKSGQDEIRTGRWNLDRKTEPSAQSSTSLLGTMRLTIDSTIA